MFHGLFRRGSSGAFSLIKAVACLGMICALAQPAEAAKSVKKKPVKALKPVAMQEHKAPPRKECRHRVVKNVTSKFIELKRQEHCF